MQNYQNYQVDLSNCDKEPIHLIGRIQPHGFLLILNRQSLVVEQVSQNISDFLTANPAELSGHTLEQVVAPAEYAALEQFLRQEPDANPELVNLQGKSFFGFLHESQGSLVLECEPFESLSDEKQVLAHTGLYSNFLLQLNKQGSLSAQSELAVQFVQQLIGYDRVMLYRFDEDWHGEVLAEKIKPGIYSYLHHHFPATDIPAQARVLLIEKPIRQIPNVAANAVDIVPYFNPGTGIPSNILRSELRNPSEIHLEYLQNMGVYATLSVSILVNGKLWGIIACHHEEPVFINYWKRQLCCSIAQTFANAVLANQELRDLQQLETFRQKEELLLQQMVEAGSIGAGLFEQEHTLLELTEATGAALYLDGRFYTIGSTPDEPILQELVAWLATTVSEKVFHTRQLSHVFPPAAAVKEQASGFLAIEISKYSKEYLLYFKPEISENRIWAGDPVKPLQEQTQRIHPRKSFSTWVEVIRGKSQAWSTNELDSTQLLVKDLTAVILRNQAKNLQSLNRQLNDTSDKLRSKNKRLEDFTHIIAHNLRSPLSNMKGLADLYEAEPDPETGDRVMQMMQNMISNMAATIDDLNLILRSELEKEQGLTWQEIALTEVVEKELQNLQSIILNTEAQVSIDLDVEHVSAPKVYLESILHNLLSNALKYRSPDKQPVISIRSWQEMGQVYIAVADNGLGMDMNKVGSKLFNLYTTFHKNKDAKGLGLYLTKMQSEALGGKIKVESTPGEGSTFTISLKA